MLLNVLLDTWGTVFRDTVVKVEISLGSHDNQFNSVLSEGERKRRRCDRDRSRDRETEASRPDKRSCSPDSSIESSSLQTGPGAGGGIDHEFEEMTLGLNMALIGQKSKRMTSFVLSNLCFSSVMSLPRRS